MRGLQEVVPIQDTLCSGIGAIEKLEGGNLRFWFFVSQERGDGEPKEKIVVAKLIAHRSVIPDAILQTIAAITECETLAAPMVPEMCH